MTKYTEQLWRELMREHGTELSRISRPARHGRVARPRLLAGTTVGLAGAGTALALILGAASSAPAFAVTKGNDGTVRVVIRQIDALSSVNARLAQLGLRARFVQAVPGCAAPPPAAVAGWFARRQARIGSVTVVRGFVHARFDPRQIPAGKTLVMTAWRQGHLIKAVPGHVVLGAVPRCLPAAQVASAIVHVRAGKGPFAQCFVTGAIRPADNPPTTATDSVPATTTGSAPTTTTATGTPPAVTTATGPPPPAGKPACPAAATPQVQKALELARRAAVKRH